MTDFIRVNRAYAQEKSFLVRANIQPPKDSIIAGDSLILIQPAKPKRSAASSVSYFAGKVTNDGTKEGAPGPKPGRNNTANGDHKEIVPEVKKTEKY